MNFLRTASAIVLALPASWAQSVDLVQNGDFSGSINDWTAAPSGAATIQYESYLGSPAGGSLRLEATEGEVAQATQCIDVHAWVSIDFILRKIKNSEYGDGAHDFQVEVYDADGCGGAQLDTIAAPEPGIAVDGIGGLTWVETGIHDALLPEGARSALIRLQTTAGPSSKSAYLLDHVRLGPLDVIFVDAFDPP